MTLTTTASRVTAAGNGSTTAFVATGIKIWANSDLLVYLKDNTTLVETLQTYTTHYTISGTLPGVPTVTFVSAPASGKTVILKRVTPNTQDLDLIASGSFAAENVEAQFDKLTGQIQDLARDLDDFPVVPMVGSYNVTDYGALVDGTTDDSAAIQAAIAAAVAAGGGIVQFPVGTCIIGTTITLYSKVLLRGVSRDTSVIKAKASLNADMLKTVNYSTLTGQNKYLSSDGVPYGFGLEAIQLNGNASNQSSGNGLVTYGKRFTLKDVIIYNVKEIGWKSEAWYNVGTATQPEQPESYYDNVDVQNCGSHGIQYRGPTDAVWQSVFSHQNAGWGIKFETDGSTYNGASDVLFAHVYANTTGGISNSTRMRFGHVCTESNFAEGLTDTSSGGTSYDFIESYINARTTGSYALLLTGSDIVVKRLYHLDGAEDVGGVTSSGNRNSILGGEMFGSASTKIGLLASGAHCHFALAITGYSGTGGIGVQFAATLTNSFIDLRLRDNKQGYNCVGTGLRNTGRISVEALSGQTLVGTDFATGEAIDVVTLDASAASVAQRLIPVGSVASPGLAFAGDRDTGIFRNGANRLSFTVGGTEALDLNLGLLLNTFSLNTAVQKASANMSIRATSGDGTDYVAAIAGNAASTRWAHWNGTAIIDRWLLGKDVTAESGANAGSDLSCYAFDDAGAFLSTVFTIQRSTGVFKFGKEIRVTGDVGGQASYNTLTGTSDVTANSTGVGTILFKGATNRNSLGFVKMYIGTTAVYVPAFSAITG